MVNGRRSSAHAPGLSRTREAPGASSEDEESRETEPEPAEQVGCVRRADDIGAAQRSPSGLVPGLPPQLQARLEAAMAAPKKRRRIDAPPGAQPRTAQRSIDIDTFEPLPPSARATQPHAQELPPSAVAAQRTASSPRRKEPSREYADVLAKLSALPSGDENALAEGLLRGELRLLLKANGVSYHRSGRANQMKDKGEMVADLLALMETGLKSADDAGSDAEQAWTPEEDEELRAAVEREGLGKWQQKAEAFSTLRSGDSLRHRWYRGLAGEQAAQARPRPAVPPASRRVGVYWSRESRQWRAQLSHGGQLVDLGYYELEEDAARAYDAAARRLRGDCGQPIGGRLRAPAPAPAAAAAAAAAR